MPKTTGPRFVADALRGYGVTHVFFVPQMLLETLTAMEGMGIRRVMTHGEKAAAYMADGYARASGKPGVCMAQHVGASNLAAGLKDAYLACAPVVALTVASPPWATPPAVLNTPPTISRNAWPPAWASMVLTREIMKALGRDPLEG